MPTNKGFVELRKQKRFDLKVGVVVEFYKSRIFNLGNPRIVNYAQITEISQGGLGFIYVDREMWLLDLNELTISDNFNKTKIDKIPFKVLRDFPISKLPNSKYLRKCGVKFGLLTSDQKSSLYSLIDTHTIINLTMDRHFGKDRKQVGDIHYKY